uniref:Uncharacterized protein n=1 Tax=Aegilops tauschii subsp. strangulata TaxID=200361 RepID=A0A453E8H9_AEGTS
MSLMCGPASLTKDVRTHTAHCKSTNRFFSLSPPTKQIFDVISLIAPPISSYYSLFIVYTATTLSASPSADIVEGRGRGVWSLVVTLERKEERERLGHK